jgi:MFS family permease
MVSQVPGGVLVDAIRSKRAAAAAATVAIMASALSIALWPAFLPIASAEVLHASASSALGPAIAALSLGLVGHEALGERLGRNARYAALGNAFAAGMMGLCGYYLAGRAVFLLTAALGLPALVALKAISREHLPRPPKLEHEPTKPSPAPIRSWLFLRDRRLLVFCLCAALFQLANAAMLPIAAGLVTERAGRAAPLVIAACIVGPQFVTALVSPWVGRSAEGWGRRPALFIGFAVLPVRGLLLAGIANPLLMIAVQLLDGLSAAAVGVLTPLIIADLTRDTGRYTTCLGLVGLAVGGGATLSTTAAGLLADQFGGSVSFLGMAGVGLCAAVLVVVAMPETKPPKSSL